jgi:hypothetical protein
MIKNYLLENRKTLASNVQDFLIGGKLVDFTLKKVMLCKSTV